MSLTELRDGAAHWPWGAADCMVVRGANYTLHQDLIGSKLPISNQHHICHPSNIVHSLRGSWACLISASTCSCTGRATPGMTSYPDSLSLTLAIAPSTVYRTVSLCLMSPPGGRLVPLSPRTSTSPSSNKSPTPASSAPAAPAPFAPLVSPFPLDAPPWAGC